VSHRRVRIETLGGWSRSAACWSAPATTGCRLEDGYVVSSAFNFIQQPSSILITTPSGKRAAAEIVARTAAECSCC